MEPFVAYPSLSMFTGLVGNGNNHHPTEDPNCSIFLTTAIDIQPNPVQDCGGLRIDVHDTPKQNQVAAFVCSQNSRVACFSSFFSHKDEYLEAYFRLNVYQKYKSRLEDHTPITQFPMMIAYQNYTFVYV